jgi:MinD-like ATPase involved in chromosome partitioning or flagellar assembly
MPEQHWRARVLGDIAGPAGPAGSAGSAPPPPAPHANGQPPGPPFRRLQPDRPGNPQPAHPYPPGPLPGPPPGQAPAPAPAFPPRPAAAPPPVPPGPSSAWRPGPAPDPAAAHPTTGRIRHGDSAVRRATAAVRRMVGTPAEDRALVSAVAGVQVPVTTGRRIAVVSARGGSGKSTVAALLGVVYAARRRDRVLALDADLNLGSLAWRLGIPPDVTLADVGPPVLTGGLTTGDQIEWAIPRHPSGLWVLPGPPPDRAAGIPPTGPLECARALSRYFGVTVIDCGAGISSLTNMAVLADAHAVLFVTHATLDGVRSAELGLRHLGASLDGFGGRAVAVLVSTNPRTEGLDLTAARAALARYAADVIRLPYDRHLAAGGSIQVDQLAAISTVLATALAAAALHRSLRDRSRWGGGR